MADKGRSLLDQVGNTPLIRLTRITRDVPPGVELYAKAEYFNPGGSVKDRAALRMIMTAIADGRLTHGKRILDATSGNTGIAYAWIGAALGFPVTLCLPANASLERKQILRAYGAELILTDAGASTDGAQRAAKILAAESPDLYFYPDQYNNNGNWQAHYATTGPEIWNQTEGRVTHFVAGLGTTGTFTGTGRYLREQNPAITLISMQPATALHGLEGLKHLDTAIVPGIYDPDLADENIEVETEDAYDMCRCLARVEGLFVGISSAANVFAAIEIAKRHTTGVIVTILADSADKYLSDPFWNDPEPCPMI
jgi:S-sulfo-L-cysteine synthase (O-acetyl-L-serine-dependent)